MAVQGQEQIITASGWAGTQRSMHFLEIGKAECPMGGQQGRRISSQVPTYSPKVQHCWEGSWTGRKSSIESLVKHKPQIKINDKSFKIIKRFSLDKIVNINLNEQLYDSF